jgi:predicted Fe-Mo cluster-binding NifX family protein
MTTAQQLGMAIVLALNKKPAVKETIKTDTGICSYFYIVKLKDGRKRRMETIAESLAKAEGYASIEVEAYGGKIISKLKKAKTYQWERPG